MRQSAFISRRRRALAVLRETVWPGRFASGLLGVFLVRLIVGIAHHVVAIPVGVVGVVAYVAYAALFVLAPMHLTWEMRSTCPFLVVVSPPRGELGRLPLLARGAALLGIAIGIGPGLLVLLLAPDGPRVLDDASLVFFWMVLAGGAIASIRSRRAGHRPDIAAGRRRFQQWHAW